MKKSKSRSSPLRIGSHKKDVPISPRRQPSFHGKRPSYSLSPSNRKSSPKRTRHSPIRRNKTSPKRSSRERHKSHSDSNVNYFGPNKSERYHSESDYIDHKPLYRSAEKDVVMDPESLKKIVVQVSGGPIKNDDIKRAVRDPERITVVRRTGEGSRPIFDRQDIVINSTSFDEEQHSRPRRSPLPVHINRRRTPDRDDRTRKRYRHSEERSRDYDRRDYGRRSPRDHTSHDRGRDDGSRIDYRRDRSNDRDRRRPLKRQRSPDEPDYQTRRDRYDDRDRRRPLKRQRSPDEHDYQDRRDRYDDRDRRRLRSPISRRRPKDRASEVRGSHENGEPIPQTVLFRGRGQPVIQEFIPPPSRIIRPGIQPFVPLRPGFLPRGRALPIRYPFDQRFPRPPVFSEYPRLPAANIYPIIAGPVFTPRNLVARSYPI